MRPLSLAFALLRHPPSPTPPPPFRLVARGSWLVARDTHKTRQRSGCRPRSWQCSHRSYNPPKTPPGSAHLLAVVWSSRQGITGKGVSGHALVGRPRTNCLRCMKRPSTPCDRALSHLGLPFRPRAWLPPSAHDGLTTGFTCTTDGASPAPTCERHDPTSAQE